MEPVLPFALDLPPRGEGARMQALHGQLRAAILDGRLPPGARLPATRPLASALGVARNTVVAAYDLLMAEGYVQPRRGAPAQVADLALRRPAPAAALEVPLGDRRLNPVWRAPALEPESPRALPERSFRLGVPDPHHFPHAVWRRLSAQTLRAWSKQPFTYPPTEGLAPLREAIAHHVAFARAVVCQPVDVVVTSGAQQAFDLLGRLLITPGQTRVAVEEPGYPPARAALLAAGAVLVPVPVDEQGLCVDQVPADVRIVAVTPSHQSPTGVALSAPRRRALLEFARAHDAVILEDDYDGEFRFGGRPLDALQTLDREGRVFYVGTFSKSLFPALRKGFVVAPAWARDALVRVKHCADAHGDAISQSVLAAFIREGHLARHVRHMRPIYAARRQALLDGLQQELSRWLQPWPSEAGLHLSARIRDPAQASAILARIRQHAPGAQSLDDYAMAPLPQRAVTFGYGVIDVAAIRPALSRLRAALETI
ncbi:MocR-like pyridoxine biosynthesis transcription factor PdxR [Agrilutibacter solisilvae]|uniref:PLP-dependent aminotransferase family protein n=1 Tax=Agrilutibacter solisilvae TaxID=2763317 RepID=A0A974Y0Q2_9GAMM|nr:PLP-dependent aminotransferase family protein [Lysobacter solisilvae]QSX79262.1 PLP-dependent aminotransferase family protein [Lysobacter solisilvae]